MADLSPVQRFSAVLERNDPAGLGWTFVRVPFTADQVWGERVRSRVKAALACHGCRAEFRSSLFLHASLGAYLLVNRPVLRALRADAGTMVDVMLQPDLEPRPAELPPELDGLLDDAEGLRSFYEGLSEYRRRELGKWILAAKGEEARQRRGQEVAERLLNTMEALVELPPAIRRRLAGPSLDGWHRMTEAQREGELMAVFSYKSPESREKRIGKLVELAARKGEAQT